MKCCTKLETAKERRPIVFQGHPSNFKITREKNRFSPNCAFPDYRPVAAFKSSRIASFLSLWTKFGKIKRRFNSFNCLFIFSLISFAPDDIFCAEVYFTYVELGSKWALVDLCCCWQPNRNIKDNYRKTSSISRTKSQNLNVSCILLQLSSLNPLKPGVKLRMKMWLEQRRQAMLQSHLSYQQLYCLLRCDLY